MERNPYFHGSDPHPPPQPDSPTDLNLFEFEFPIAAISDPPNDIVFCNKILGRRQTNPNPPRKSPFLLRSESVRKINYGRRDNRSVSVEESRRRSSSGRWKHNNGLFGGLKYPLQMELSDIKMRQGRREPEPVSLPRITVGCDGETEAGGGSKSRWGLVRRLSLRRRGSPPTSPFAKASFGCLPIPMA